jgi:iron complex transport system substrate-binding protein
VGDKIVGVTTFCDYPPEAKRIDKVSDYIQPDLEKVIAKNPDLIVTSQENSSRREIEFLIRKGYRVVTYESDTLAQLKKTILELGRELGKIEKAEQLLKEMDIVLGQLKKRSPSPQPSPVQGEGDRKGIQRALFVVSHHPLVVAGSQNIFDDAASYLGVINIAGKSRLKYPTYSLEQLLAQAPDIILDFSMGSEASETSKKEILDWWKKFPSLPAVREGRIFFLDMGVMRASPRLVGEWVKLFEKVHKNL